MKEGEEEAAVMTLSVKVPDSQARCWESEEFGQSFSITFAWILARAKDTRISVRDSVGGCCRSFSLVHAAGGLSTDLLFDKTRPFMDLCVCV